MPLPENELRALVGLDQPNTDSTLSDEELLGLINSEPQQTETTSTSQDQGVDQYLVKDQEQAANPPVAEELRRLQRAAAGVYTSQPNKDEQFREYVDILKQAGVHADFALDKRFRKQTEAEAAVAARRFLNGMQVGGVPILDLQGEDVERAKKQVLNAFTVASLAKNAPVVGREARVLAANVVRDEVNKQITRIMDQVSGGGTISLGADGSQVIEAPHTEETMRLAALAQIVNQADDDMLFKAMQTGFSFDPVDPKNPTEQLRQTIPSDIAPLVEAPFLRTIAEVVNLSGISAESARIGAVNSAGTAPSSKRGEDVIATIAAILGDGWINTLRVRYRAARTRHNLGKLGVDFDNGGAPGYSEDSVNFVPILAGDAFDVLKKQAAAHLQDPTTQNLSKREKQELHEIIEGDDEAQAALDKIQGKFGIRGKNELARALIEESVGREARVRARVEALGTEEVDPNLTPTERAYMGGLNSALFDMMGRSEQYFGALTRNLKRQDSETNRAFEDLTGVALDKNFTYMLTQSEDLSDATDGFFDAYVFNSAMNRDRGEFMGGIRRWLQTAQELMRARPESRLSQNPRVRAALEQQQLRVGKYSTAPDRDRLDLGEVRISTIQNHPMFQGLTSESTTELLKQSVDVGEIYAQNTRAAEKERDKIMKRLMLYQRQVANGEEPSQNWLSHKVDVARMGTMMLGDMAREIGRIFTENPEEAAGMIMLEVPTDIGVAAARRFAVQKADLLAGRIVGSLTGDSVRGKTLSQIFHASKLGQALRRLQYSNPVMASRMAKRMEAMHARALADGDIEDHADALAAAATSARRVADEVDLTGGVSNAAIHDMSKKISDVWDKLSADPGDLENFIKHAEASTRRGIFRTLVERGKEVIGSGGKAHLRDIVHDRTQFDMALEGLDQLISGGDEPEKFVTALNSLAERTGRGIDEITPDEIEELLPPQINDLIGIMDQAQKIPITQPMFKNRIANGLRRMRGATTPEAIDFFKNSVEDTVSLASMRMVDSAVMKAGWHGTSKRIGRVLDHLRERRRAELQLVKEEANQVLNNLDPETTTPEDLNKVMEHFDKKRLGIENDIKEVERLFGRVREHDADLRFDPRTLPAFEKLTDNDIEALLTEAPELFGISTGDVIEYKVTGKGTKKQIDRINTQIANKEKKIEALKDELIDAEAAGTVMAGPDLDAKEALLEKLGLELEDLDRKAVTLKEGRLTRAAVDRQAFFDALAHSGLDETADARKKSLTDLRSTVATSRNQGLGSNPFLPNVLPLRQQMKFVSQAVQHLSARFHNQVARMRLLEQAKDLMTPEEVLALNQVLKDVKGFGISGPQIRKRIRELTKKHPELRAYFDDPANFDLVRGFAKDIDQNLGTLYAMMEELGVDEPVIRAFREKGYDPNLYGLYERKRLVLGPQQDRLFKVAAKNEAPIEPLLGATGESLRFQRRFVETRVVIDEPGQRVEKNFRNERQARNWVKRRYGKKIKFRKDAERGVEIAEHKATGDVIRIGKPLGRLGVAILDPIGGRTERMLVGISRAYKDLGTQQLFQALNAHGNLVVDADTFGKLVERYGNRINKQYVPIPDNKTLFGGVAGKHVHRKVLGDINKAARAYDSLDEVIKGMREVIHRTGGDASIIDLIGSKVPGLAGQLVESLTGVFKQNLILLNQRVWVGNFLFNVVLDAASGADMFGSIDGWKSYAWAWRQRFRGQVGDTLPLPMKSRGPGEVAQLSRESLVSEAVEGGLLDGFFEASGGPNAESRMLARMMGFEDLGKMQERLANRQGLLAKLQKQGTLHPEEKANIVNLHKDISAIEIQIEELQRGWFRKVGRNMTAMLGDQGLLRRVAQDTMGRRGGETQRRAWDWLRDMYNNIDSAYKLGTYHHLRVNKGWGKEEALAHVKDFAQNYRDIPQWLRPTGGKGAFLSLVTSFPYEATRIAGNLMMKKPGRMAAVLGMLPMMNLAMLTQAGIDKEQFFALLETRGAKTKVDAALSLFDTFYVPGPNISIASTLDLGLVFPWINLINNDFNPLARFGESMTGLDSELDMALQIPLRYLGNYVFNNPIFGGTVSMTGGFDEDTGRPLWDDRMSADQKVGAMINMMTKGILPPWVPYARAWEDYNEADNAPINPRTGRPFDAQQKGTVVSRQFGFAVKGKGANAAGKLLSPFTPQAIGDDFQDPSVDFANPENVLVNLLRKASEDPGGRRRPLSFPIFSKDSELREWTLRKMQSDDPAKRAEAENEIDRIIDENYEVFWKPLGRTRKVTDRERQKLEQYIRDYTVEAQMGRLEIHQQTAVLMEMDRLGMFSDRRMADMIQQVKFSPLGDVRISGDPEKVMQSIEVLDSYIKDNPSSNQRLSALKSWLMKTILPQSKKRRQRELLRQGIEDKRKAAAGRARFEP